MDPGPGPLLSLPPHVPSTTAATCASTTDTAPCRSSCPLSLYAVDQSLRRLRGLPPSPLTRRTPLDHAPPAATGSWEPSVDSATRGCSGQPRQTRAVGLVGTSPGPRRPTRSSWWPTWPLGSLVEESGETSELAGRSRARRPDRCRDGAAASPVTPRLSLLLTTMPGHTMYEGRARRFPPLVPSDERVIRRDRHCRFPGRTDRHLCQCPPHRPVETRRWHRPAEPGAFMPPSPRGGAPKGMVPLWATPTRS